MQSAIVWSIGAVERDRGVVRARRTSLEHRAALLGRRRASCCVAELLARRRASARSWRSRATRSRRRRARRCRSPTSARGRARVLDEAHREAAAPVVADEVDRALRRDALRARRRATRRTPPSSRRSPRAAGSRSRAAAARSRRRGAGAARSASHTAGVSGTPWTKTAGMASPCGVSSRCGRAGGGRCRRGTAPSPRRRAGARCASASERRIGNHGSSLPQSTRPRYVFVFMNATRFGSM